jgi:ribonucleoside-triphosphate reductase
VTKSTAPAAAAPAATEEAPADFSSAVEDSTMLFATATCPNCKVAAALLDKAGIEFTKLIAEEHPDLVKEFGIKQAPTLVVIKDGNYTNYKGVSDIKKYIENR